MNPWTHPPPPLCSKTILVVKLPITKFHRNFSSISFAEVIVLRSKGQTKSPVEYLIEGRDMG